MNDPNGMANLQQFQSPNKRGSHWRLSYSGLPNTCDSQFQSPNKRGSHWRLLVESKRARSMPLFQSPNKRGSHWRLPDGHGLETRTSFSPLISGEVIGGKKAAATDAVVACKFQSPNKRGSHWRLQQWPDYQGQ